MDKFLRPARFDAIPNTTGSDKAWLHWKRTFTNFLTSIEALEPAKLVVFANYVSPEVFEYITDAEDYASAIATLESLYITPKNEIFARHLLATRRQQPGESLDEFLNALKLMGKDCNFKPVTAEEYRKELIRDAFINGLSSQRIRQRLLENTTLELEAAFTQARLLDSAQKSSDTYSTQPLPLNAATSSAIDLADSTTNASTVRAKNTQRCFFCGNYRHNRQVCPARDCICNKCGKLGHFAQVCQSSTRPKNPSSSTSASIHYPTLATISATSPQSLKKAVVKADLNGRSVEALIDTGSSDSFISQELATRLCLKVIPAASSVSMAESSLTAKILGYSMVSVKIHDNTYHNVKLSILENLCTEVIIGQDILHQHKSLDMQFGGTKPTLSVCGLTTLLIPPPSLFANLTPDCKPIATKSRKYSMTDRKFIELEVQKLLREDIIEPSISPWRAQVVVTTNERHKKRMVIDYSQTINRYTQLDAYPLPRIDEQANEVARHKVFSTIDLKDAYYQVPISDSDKPYTAFEAAGKLYQYKRMPFGITNGVACFQRAMDEFIADNKLSGTYAYLDNITVCGKTQEEHDENLEKFLAAAKDKRLKFNETKCTFSTTSINLLGYNISDGEMKPDPDRLKPLRELPAPHDMKTQKRVIGLFSYYSKWIPKFSAKIKPLTSNTTFPLSQEALNAFELLKTDIEESVVSSIDETQPFVVETDASEFAIAATLNQGGRPVAFFSRTLDKSELQHHSVEKEAYSIVESIRYWRHYLAGKHFKLITDQRSVSYMYDAKHPGKIKNDKIQRWRLELASYNFDIVYRPGKDNIPADTFTRVFCSATSPDSLMQLHNSLCHPGVTRMIHYVRTKNLSVSIEEIKKVTATCPVCAECKPRFYKPPDSHLVKATQPFERLSMDFKGPLPSTSRNRYILTVVDEFSRFPFAIPCSDISTPTVIRCLCSIFSIFGMPMYIHSDRGASFMSQELKNFFHNRNISTSRTTPYNPRGNGQCERYNGIIWKAITLACHSQDLNIKHWEAVLPDALHSIRSLLCTSTNATPHERIFNYTRRSSYGESIPTWLSNPGPVLLRRYVRNSKYDPLIDEVELLEANPSYAFVRYPDGRESTVSVRDLAPQSKTLDNATSQKPTNQLPMVDTTPNTQVPIAETDPPTGDTSHAVDTAADASTTDFIPRRSTRERRPPNRLDL